MVLKKKERKKKNKVSNNEYTLPSESLSISPAPCIFFFSDCSGFLFITAFFNLNKLCALFFKNKRKTIGVISPPFL